MSQGKREPPTPPPVPSLAPPATQPPGSADPATCCPHPTKGLSAGSPYDVEEELIDWGDDSPGHIYCPVEDGVVVESTTSAAGVDIDGDGCVAAGGGAAAAGDGSGVGASAGAPEADGAPPKRYEALPAPPAAPAKLKSVLVYPGRRPELLRRPSKSIWKRLDLNGAPALGSGDSATSGVNTKQGEPVSPRWQEAKTGRRRRAPTVPHRDFDAQASTRCRPSSTAKLAFKSRFAGKCFRCLASDHHIAHCRDPLRCILCKRSGHCSRDCPSARPRIIPEHL